MEIAANRQPSVLRRKRALAGCEAFDVKTEDALAVGARNVLRQRFQSELAAVRRLVHRAAAVQRSEEPPAKRIKASPPPPAIKRTEAPKKMTQGERELLAADLAGLAAQLPDHIVELLEKQSCGTGGGEMEIDIHAVEDAALVELQKQVDKFIRGRADPAPQQQQDDDKMMDKHEEDVDIVGGVSPLAIAPAPLQLAGEEEEDVDICGDASPVVMPKNLGDDAISSGSPTSSSSDSDSDSASDSSSSDSDSESDSDESVDSPVPAERAATPPRAEMIARAKESLEKQRKEARWRAREKARQEVLETERTAMPSETIDPTVLESLHIVDQYNRARPDSLLRRLGLFLKADDYDIEEQQHHRHRQSFLEDLEEGEIRQ